ncbi:hypothetical protein [Pseudomonas phage vB_PaeM_PS119XW]|uniref:Uncharacterized protein n=1 Tax=Pseudomonas phage vB_PaeM_PS119XW TaxID=2601632 RepID=A0A5C1K9Q0_9CAUD|nr:hypothetical protein PP933_gp285 [Pseudomonas phage vB_PaeM_PS119XW]QEM42014.1 hypothetical protein [Pseudomonas phage vB_PaeM_PS119XW]
MSHALKYLTRNLDSEELYLLLNWKTDKVLSPILQKVGILSEEMGEEGRRVYYKFDNAIWKLCRIIRAEYNLPDFQEDLISVVRNYFKFTWRDDKFNIVIFEEPGYARVEYSTSLDVMDIFHEGKPRRL